MVPKKVPCTGNATLVGHRLPSSLHGLSLYLLPGAVLSMLAPDRFLLQPTLSAAWQQGFAPPANMLDEESYRQAMTCEGLSRSRGSDHWESIPAQQRARSRHPCCAWVPIMQRLEEPESTCNPPSHSLRSTVSTGIKYALRLSRQYSRVEHLSSILLFPAVGGLPG